jgi:3-(3-hydroxy-phenyl)propionate hydroxylase
LVHKDRRVRQLAGRLCPNAVTGTGARLDSLVGQGFSVVTAVLPTAAQREMLEGRNVDLYYAGPGTPLAEWLRHGKARAVIVRPDFTVLGAGDDLSTLCASLPSSGV